MRQVVFDTETTGLYPAEGDRVISIGCVEIVDRRITGREWHTRLNPDGRASHPMALKVHGISDESLLTEPRFADAKLDFWNFIRGADELIAHNAPFDVGFLNAEIARLGSPLKFERMFKIVDTMKLPAAEGMRVGGSLNALADRYGIDRSAREQFHGALVDARLLAEVYLAMTRGNEQIELEPAPAVSASEAFVAPRPEIPVIQCTPAELAAHEAMMAEIKGAP